MKRRDLLATAALSGMACSKRDAEVRMPLEKSTVAVIKASSYETELLSRLEEGKVEICLEEINFHSFCQDVIDDMHITLKKGQKIITHHHNDNLTIEMDKKLLKLILINLISNASKYSDEGKTIICKTKKVGQYFTISIIDEGMGIPEEDKPHMFDRFFRASNAMNIKGTGLGLHIVKRYAEMMNGELTFESELSKGSTFTVTLLLAK